jgi:hypothetical protein
MKVKIYQAGIEAKNKFMDLEFTNRVCGGVNSNDYNVVFDGELPVSNLEAIYMLLNTSRPEGYTGHSLSVSDIVVTEEGAFYCDSFGFTEIDF